MADTYEKNLAQKSSLTTSDYIRVVGSDNVSYKQLISDVADVMLTRFGKTATYTGDLNALAINGYWYCTSSATNLPTGFTVGHLIVTSVSTRVLQIFVQYLGASTCIRTSADGGSTWGEWKSQPTRAEVDALAKGHVSFAGTAGDTPTTLIQNGLSNGNIPYNQAFVARISTGYYFWAVGHFYISSNKTYGSAIVSRPGYTCKVNCSADVWTETAI